MKKKTVLYSGLALIAAGLLFNRWTIENILYPGKNITKPNALLVLYIIQVALIGLGLFLALKRPQMTRNHLLFITLSILLVFLLFEIGARIWLYHIASPEQYLEHELFTKILPGKFRYSPHHYLNYTLTPNYRNGLTSHNSLGYRNREFTMEKPENIFRIAVLGGSSTYAVKVKDNEKIFTYLAEGILAEDYGYETVEIINAGVGGYTTWESLINLEFRVQDLSPDIVMVYHGTNDVHSRIVLKELYRGDNSGQRKQWAPQSIPFFEKSCFLRILSRRMRITNQFGLGSLVNRSDFIGERSAISGDVWNNRPEQFIEQNPPIYFRRNIVNMVALTQIHKIPVILVTWAFSPLKNDYASTAHYRQGFEQHNEVLKEIAQKYGTLLFDFAAQMSPERSYWADGRHVNEAGSLLKARFFADFLHESGLLPKK